MLTFAYGELARLRRRWYALHSERRRRLARPVISIGNLTVGGTGKTPLTGYLARLLIDSGERPSILSRGYGRTSPVDGVVVVRGPAGLVAGLAESGDEPLMLAESLDGASVLVSPDRYIAGRLAELRFGSTVHLLDDGFQHFGLERDLDLLVVDPDEMGNSRTLPFGRLREPLSCASAADAAIVTDGSQADAEALARDFRIPRAFCARRILGRARVAYRPGDLPQAVAPENTRTIAVAGIARPKRFFADLRAQGWTVWREMIFRDHHPFSKVDIVEIERAAAEANAELILTTEKDMIRLRPLCPLRVPVAWVPLSMHVEPEAGFREWLFGRLGTARALLDRRHAR